MAVRFQPKAARDAKGLPRQDRDRLIERLERIARDPRGNHPDVERLKGVEGVYRVRQGDWRAIYEITPGRDIEVTRVAHRREVYRR